MISRRHFVRGAAGLLIPAAVAQALPVMQAGPRYYPAAQPPGYTFDYYIGPSGSDANAGTVASPWAITSLMRSTQNAHNVANFTAIAGKRLGLLPGTYSVGAYAYHDSSTGALQIPGGSSGASTYVASCDSSGNYSPRTATITALNAGVYGGITGYNGPIIGHCGTYPASYPVGYMTMDGLVISGFSYKGVRIGAGSSGDGPSNLYGIVIQNCEFTGGAQNAGASTDNCDALWIDSTIGAVITNNYFHDNSAFGANKMDHLDAVILWLCQGTTIQFNTVVNAGNIYGKEVANQGTTVQNNYVDSSMYTDLGAASGIADFTGANTSGLTQTSYIRNNIIISSGWGIQSATLSYNYGWTTPVEIYNNTIVLNSNATPYPAAWVTAQGSGNGHLKFYNNIYTGSADGSGYKAFRLNPSGPSVWDYNLFKSSGMSWALSTDATLSTALGSYTTQSAFAAAMAANGGISGADSHSVANNTPGFAGTGTYAALYKTPSGAAFGAGKVDGTSGGATCNIGAWDGTVTQIGCDWVN